jgi:hypothetical protein
MPAAKRIGGTFALYRGWFREGSTDKRRSPVKNLSLAILVMALATAAAGAVATGAVTATAAPQLSRFMVADQVKGPPEHPDDSKAGGPAVSPSKKLSESKGVIQPPATGDHSVVAPPPTETTNKAVIAPPGTPGGDQSVQPK